MSQVFSVKTAFLFKLEAQEHRERKGNEQQVERTAGKSRELPAAALLAS
jgi:hypothetical protein